MSTFQVCLKGVQKYAKDKQIIQQLQAVMGDKFIQPLQLYKPKMKPFCFISLENEEQKQLFTNILNEAKESGLRVGEANNTHELDRQLEKKAKQEFHQQEMNQQLANQKEREPFERDPAEVTKQTAPLIDMKYEDQILFKQAELERVISKFKKQYLHKVQNYEEAPDWIKDTSKIVLNEPIICPETYRYNYRNKSEFTVNYNSKNEVTVGFNCGSFQRNDASVERPNSCQITPKIAIQLANKFEEYLKTSQFEPFNKNSGKGVWRLLSVRKSDRTKQLLLSVSINQNNVTEEQKQQIKQDLVKLFNDTGDYKLAGLILMHSSQLGQEIASSINDTEILIGNNYYQEIILGKTINVSYNAFVQNHSEQCDELYKAIMAQGNNLIQPKFLDICAGSGTIGICVSDRVSEVIAIEMNEQSCEDAKLNYQINNTQNCKIICSKVEDVIKQVTTDIRNQQQSQFIACLDPPRAGVLATVIDSLRTCKGLDSIVYVSCSPLSIIDNLVSLCLPQSKKNRAPGFIIKSATLVDMFPQTSHFETIFYMERDYGPLFI